MTNAQRAEARTYRTILAALTARPMTAGQLARRLPQQQRLAEKLVTMAELGLVHVRNERQYPGGLTETVWHAGPEPIPTQEIP